MGNVDQADQLRSQYCIHYWLRNRKWWWAHFFWIFELSLTNAFVLYRMFQEIHNVKVQLTHYEFIKKIALAWIDQDIYWPTASPKMKKSQSSSSFSSSRSIITRRSSAPLQSRKCMTFSDRSLDPFNGFLQFRLDRHLNHFPIKNDKPEANCQLHFYTARKKHRANLIR